MIASSDVLSPAQVGAAGSRDASVVGRNGQGQTRVPAGWRLQGYGAKRWSLRSFVATARHGVGRSTRRQKPRYGRRRRGGPRFVLRKLMSRRQWPKC